MVSWLEICRNLQEEILSERLQMFVVGTMGVVSVCRLLFFFVCVCKIALRMPVNSVLDLFGRKAAYGNRGYIFPKYTR